MAKLDEKKVKHKPFEQQKVTDLRYTEPAPNYEVYGTNNSQVGMFPMVRKGANHLGAMLSIDLPINVAKKIAIDTGEPPENMHITLFYFGDNSELTEKNKEDIKAISNNIIKNTESFEIDLSKGEFKSFDVNDDGEQPFVALIKSPELMKLRKTIAEAFDNQEIKYAKDYEYTPHITLKYLSDNNGIPETPSGVADVKLTGIFKVNELKVHFAGEIVDIKKGKVYLDEGEQPPNKEQVLVGKRGGKFYQSQENAKSESIETVKIPMFTRPSGEAIGELTVPRYVFHIQRVESDNGIKAYSIREKEAASAFGKGHENNKYVWLSREPLDTQNSLVVDLSKVDVINLRDTGQSEGHLLHRGDIPESAVIRNPKIEVRPEGAVGGHTPYVYKPNIQKEGAGVGTVSSGGFTPTFNGAGGPEIDFFNTKKKIHSIIKKEHQPNPPWPNTVFDENKHRWVSIEEQQAEKSSVVNTIKTLGTDFKNAGFELYEVGGSVRDSLLGKDNDDQDLTTNALPEQTKQILSNSKLGSVFTIGEEYGTIGLQTGDKKIEITTFRGEVYPTSSRKPEVKFGSSLKDDLSRRDFTFNAIARNINTGELIDLFGGQEDLKNKKIKTVGDSKSRFAEDPLRMMRAVRFASQLNFDVDVDMPEPEKLKNISKERINSELVKILKSNNPMVGIALLDKFGLMKYIIPEIDDLKGVTQNKYHKHDVYNHTLEVARAVSQLEYFGQDKAVLMLAALLHDISKPETKTDEGGEVHFYDHQKVGADKVKKILSNLKFDTDTIDRVSKLVEFHMDAIMNIDSPSDITDRFVTRLIRKIGDSDAPLLIDLASSDVGASANPRPDIVRALKEKTTEILKKIKPSELTSPITGNEIMNKFSLKPGKLIGKVKDELTKKVIDGELGMNDKEEAFKIAEELLGSNEFIKSVLTESFDEIFYKAQDRVYISSPSEAPKGVQVKRGARGGLFYEGNIPKAAPTQQASKAGYQKGSTKNITWIPAKKNKTLSGLNIPKTWQPEFTQISSDKKSDMQARGIDAKGRKVYLYSVTQQNKSKAIKFKRLQSFNKQLPKLKAQIEKDFDKKEEAAILYLISKTGFRIGSNRDTKGAVQAYGASTLERRHINITKDVITFNFIGKKGVHIKKKLKDARLAEKFLKITDPEETLFNTDDSAVRKYLSSITGKPFKVKDFRTWTGTSVAIEAIKKLAKPTDEKSFRKFQIEVGRQVAEVLGNTYSVALSAYIAPEVFNDVRMSIASISKAIGINSIDDLLETISYEEIKDEQY